MDIHHLAITIEGRFFDTSFYDFCPFNATSPKTIAPETLIASALGMWP
jgi:hypothetical protein